MSVGFLHWLWSSVVALSIEGLMFVIAGNGLFVLVIVVSDLFVQKT